MTAEGEGACRLRVLHVVAGLHPNAGGPSRTVVQLTDALARIPDVAIALLSQRRVDEPTVGSEVGEVDRRLALSSSRCEIRLAVPIRRELKRSIRHSRPSIVHSHGLWNPANHWASQTAHRHDIPLVVHPRGMLEPWALQHKAWKKRIGMAIFQRRDLRNARVLMATSQAECENIRALGFQQPIALIPNGVILPPPMNANVRSDRHGARIRSALFLSRVHPKKGVLNLVHAWSRLAPPNWRLKIAGPSEGGHLAEVMGLARRLGSEASIDYVGAVEGEEKTHLYRDSDLFVLPTFSENFGVVVAEALAHGVPVITTHGAPWAELEVHRCGWWIGIGVEPLVEALRTGTTLTDDERRSMGLRGREYVRRFAWDTIARDTLAVYSWVVGEGPRPECVEVP